MPKLRDDWIARTHARLRSQHCFLGKSDGPALVPPLSLHTSLVLGALAVLPWVLASFVGAEAPSTFVIMGGAAGAIAVGGTLGLLSHRAHTRSALLWLHVGLVLCASIPSRWALPRALSLAPAFTEFLRLCGATMLAWWLSRYVPRVLSQSRFSAAFRVTLHAMLFAACTLVTFRASHLVGQAFPVATVAVAALLGLHFALPRVRTAWIPAALAFGSYALLLRVDPSYADVRGTLTACICCGSFVALRLSLPLKANAKPALDALACAVWLASFPALHFLMAQAPYTAGASAGGAWASILGAMQKLSDYDADGYGILFGEHDCAPFDPATHPGSHESPANGLDDNCAGGDASARPGFLREQLAVNPPPPSFAGDVVMVVVDTLRADAIRPGLPNIRGFARSARSFDRAYPTATFTVQSLAGILGARLPSDYDYAWSSPHDGRPNNVDDTLFSRLRAEGFATAAVGIGGPSMLSYLESAEEARYIYLDSTAAASTDLGIALWRRLEAQPDKRRFLYVHYVSAHSAAGDEARYRALVRELDAELGRLFDAIGEGPLWVLTADHGEAFGEHNVAGHSSTLYVEALRVPLFVRHASIVKGTEHAVTSLLALGPTLLSMVGTRTIRRGPFLCLGQPDCGDMPAPMALEKPKTHMHGLIVGDSHLIHDLKLEQVLEFDLGADPREQSPRAPSSAAAQRLAEWEEHAFLRAGVRGVNGLLW